MKKTETPNTDMSASGDDKTSPESTTISVDSKGTAQSISGATSEPTKARPTSGDKKDSEGVKNTTESQNSTPKKPSSDAGQTPSKNGKSSSDANSGKQSPLGVKARLLLSLAIIIIIALAAGWSTRDFWWLKAEPTLKNILPQSVLAKIAPANIKTGMDDLPSTSEDTSGSSKPIDEPAQTGASSSNTDLSENIAPSASAPAPDMTARDSEAGNQDAGETSPSDMAAQESSENTNSDQVIASPGISQRLSRLEGTISALKERLDSQSSDGLNASVSKHLAEIEARTAPIEDLARVENEVAGLATQIRDLSAKLSTMEQQVEATSELQVESRGQAVAMAVSLLRDALQRGGPFVIALNQLERAAGTDEILNEKIAILKPLAIKGAPTLEQLRMSFDDVAKNAIEASSDDHVGSIWSSIWSNLLKLFPVRRVDVVGEESLDGRLATAEAALKQDDLAAAVDAISTIEGPHTQKAVASWLSQAKDRMTINKTMTDLGDHAISLLTGAEDDK